MLLVLVGKLYLTAETRFSYSKALSSTEAQLSEELKHKVAYLNSQAPYLVDYKRSRKLDLEYCENLSCIDSLELHFQEKLSDTTIVSDNTFPFLYTQEFNQWNKLKSLMRLQPLVMIYEEAVMGHAEMFFTKAAIIKGAFGEPFVGFRDYNPVLDNNLISINNGHFLRDTFQWFTVPYTDTLKITYFKDNFSYGMGRDSIIKKYVYDISHLKSKMDQ